MMLFPYNQAAGATDLPDGHGGLIDFTHGVAANGALEARNRLRQKINFASRLNSMARSGPPSTKIALPFFRNM
jgi:hypothetical protein